MYATVRTTRKLNLPFVVIAGFACVGIVSPPVGAETVLVMTGTYASAADQLAVDFSIPGPGDMSFVTYASAGGTAPDHRVGMPPGLSIPAGGIDSLLRLFNSTNTQIGINDDHDGTLDSHLTSGPYIFLPAGATQIPTLAAGDYRIRQDVFGSNLNNGTFALTAFGSAAFPPAVGAYTITGLTRTAGVTINDFYFGQTPGTASQIGRIAFDSPSDVLSVTGNINLFGYAELALSAGSITSTVLQDVPILGANGGIGLINLNGGSLSSVNQIWGNAEFQGTFVNHSAGSNNVSNVLRLGMHNSANAVYNLSGSGTVAAEQLALGQNTSSPIGSHFNQTGGVADFDFVFIAPAVPTGGDTHTYRLLGGTAMIDLLQIRSEGVFELAGGTLALPFPGRLETFGVGQFIWLSGTVQLPNYTLDSTAGQFFGPTLTLTPGRTMEILGTTTNNSVLTLNGGRFITSTLGGPGAYVLNSGELRITGAGGLTVGAAGPLGNVLSIKPDFLLNVSNGLVVQTGSLLNVQDGGRVQAGSVTNNAGGIIQLAGPAARLEGTGAINNSGVLSGNGIVAHSLTNSAGGEVSASIGQTLRFTNAAAHSNQGLMRLAGGELLFAGAITNGAAGNIEGRGVLRTGGLTNQGDVALSNGVTDVHGDVVNAAGGRTIVSGNADVTFWDDVQNNGALFKVSAGSSATFFGAYGGAGITGTGNVNFEADVTPGSSPALTSFEANVSFGSISRLAIELGGTARGSQYDALDVTGSLSLGGALDVSLINGFTPSAGQTFDILNWGSLAGAFSSISLPTLAGLTWNTSQLYTTGILSITSAGLPGDFNQDGAVNAADYVAWRKGIAVESTPANYNLWRSHFGETIGGGSSATDSAGGPAVPEPATWWSAACCALVASFIRRSITNSKIGSAQVRLY
jgi:hypothetical protein